MIFHTSNKEKIKNRMSELLTLYDIKEGDLKGAWLAYTEADHLSMDRRYLWTIYCNIRDGYDPMRLSVPKMVSGYPARTTILSPSDS